MQAAGLHTLVFAVPSLALLVKFPNLYFGFPVSVMEHWMFDLSRFLTAPRLCGSFPTVMPANSSWPIWNAVSSWCTGNEVLLFSERTYPFCEYCWFLLKKITFVYFLFKFLVLENVDVSTVFKLSSFPLSFIFSCIPHFLSKYQPLLTYYCYTHTLLSQFTVAHMYVCVRLKIWDWITL